MSSSLASSRPPARLRAPSPSIADRAGSGTASAKSWHPFDDRLIKRTYRTAGLDVLAAVFPDRSRADIEARATVLGLTAPAAPRRRAGRAPL